MGKSIRLNLLVPLLASLFGLAACGRAPSVDPRFAPYFTEFQTLLNERGITADVDVDAAFGQLDSLSHGAVCHLRSFKTPKIEVDEEQWNRATDMDRRMLIFHELGHCVFHRKHVEAKTESGRPLSIMYPVPGSLSLRYYSEHKDEYLTELFREED